MFEIKKYISQINNIIFKIKYNFNLYYIRQYIYKAKNVQDLIAIMKNIASNKTLTLNKIMSSDELFTILTDCFIKYPLSEKELQKMSILEQLYNTEHGINNYTTTVIWLCTIVAIQESEES